jgi:hypothetical protein
LGQRKEEGKGEKRTKQQRKPIKHTKQIEARSGAPTYRVLDFRVGAQGCTLQNTVCHYSK